ncbi:hypothetical protein NL676_033671 [Syzygium grande]|nr:hypothetical protein NL676_033671 [Syzygium grande]
MFLEPCHYLRQSFRRPNPRSGRLGHVESHRTLRKTGVSLPRPRAQNHGPARPVDLQSAAPAPSDLGQHSTRTDHLRGRRRGQSDPRWGGSFASVTLLGPAGAGGPHADTSAGIIPIGSSGSNRMMPRQAGEAFVFVSPTGHGGPHMFIRPDDVARPPVRENLS